jgi:serine/threonine protein kinase
MADVFRAELVGAEGVTRELVIKKVLHTLSLDREAVEMFVQEARVAARLHHPNVVQVYEFGRADDGYFLAMELVEGCDLAALLKAHAGASLPLGVVAFVFQELLEALGYVHGLPDAAGRPLGLVHRDISPHNVLLGRVGEVKLADFGIATASARVHDGGVKGKFAYMAPEQARGDRLDARADLYAVGAMLYEALAGRRALPTCEAEVMLDAARRGAIEPIEAVAPWVDPALAAVVARAVARDPDERFPDARAFREALAEAMFVAGAAPERATLQAMVRARTEEAPSPRADRTLTSHDDTYTNDDDEPKEEGPSAEEPEKLLVPEPSAPSRSRRLFERAMIAAGVFTLAVLAERRTRPHPAPIAVTVALPDEAGVRGWFDGTGRGAAAGRCHCRVEARYYRQVAEVEGWLRRGEVTLAAVTSVALAQVRPHIAPGGMGRVEGVRPAVAQALRAEGDAFAPVAVDLVMMAVRDEALVDGRQRFAQRREAIVGAVDAQVGHGMPAGYAWSDDPTAWTWWDVLATAWMHRSPGAPGGVALGLGGEGGLGAWYALAGPWGGDGSAPNDLRGLEETAAWRALFGALGLTAPTAEGARDVVYLGAVRGLAAEAGWSLYAPPARPRGAAGASPIALHGEVLGWVARAQARPDAPARDALLGLNGQAQARALARAWRAVPARPEAARSAVQELPSLIEREEGFVERGFTLARCPPGGKVAAVEAALGRVMAQASTGRPAAFVGEGRWWWPRIHAAAVEAFGAGEVDGGL